MKGYGQFCPVAKTAEIFAQRWTPLIVRELVIGNTRFNDIARAMPGISRSLLVQRLEAMVQTVGRSFGYSGPLHLSTIVGQVSVPNTSTTWKMTMT